MRVKPALQYRRNVGIAVFNVAGQVLIAERSDRQGAWQMPQGGLDGEEDPWQAALRELQEEIGTAKVAYLGEIKPWLRYDFPAQHPNPFRGHYIGQEQKWFAARFTGHDGEIDLHTTDHSEFTDWRWADLTEILTLIVDFKRPIYEEITRQFERFTKGRS